MLVKKKHRHVYGSRRLEHNGKLCMGQKWQKLQIQDLLSKVYPKGLIFKMTLFSLIDLDKIMPKNPK